MKLFLVVAVFALAVHCVSCTKPGPEKKQTAVRFVTWKPNQPQVWDEILKIFHEENPDLRVEREIGPHSSTAFHDLLTQKLKNRSTDVDVFFMDVIWPPEFAAAGWAMPLDDRFPRQEREKFLPGTILANTFDGKIYGVPLFIDSGMLFYRKDLLEQYGFTPPVTWTDLIRQAEAIMRSEGEKGNEIHGLSAQFKQYEGLVCNMLEYILGSGGSIIDPETGLSGLTKGPSVEAVRFVRDSVIGKVAPRGVLTYQEPESLDLFIQGKAVFLRSWPYAWEVSNDPERSRIAGKTGIARLPHFEGGESYSTLGGWQLGISSYSRNREAAWRFVEFLTSPRIQKLYAIGAGKAPARLDLYGDAGVLAANPHFGEMKDVFLSAYPRPRSPLYPSISNVLQRYFSTAISTRGSDIETLAEDASEEINRTINIGR